MIRRFCDKCGIEQGAQRIVTTQAGFLDYVPRTIDLCDNCRKQLRALLDEWLKEKTA